MTMNFNGELWMTIEVTEKQKGEPDEFVIVKNPKFGGGLIPYARYGDDWTTTVPNRILIRELMLALEKEMAAAARNKKTSFLNELIETVREQGCVRLETGEDGIPRKIEITPEYEIVEVSTDSGTGDYEIEEVEEIVFVG